jgi:hypothetical protein
VGLAGADAGLEAGCRLRPPPPAEYPLPRPHPHLRSGCLRRACPSGAAPASWRAATPGGGGLGSAAGTVVRRGLRREAPASPAHKVPPKGSPHPPRPPPLSGLPSACGRTPRSAPCPPPTRSPPWARVRARRREASGRCGCGAMHRAHSASRLARVQGPQAPPRKPLAPRPPAPAHLRLQSIPISRAASRSAAVVGMIPWEWGE